jgi:hypothetical protein
MLGVDAASIRQITDGKVTSFRTPGGHRRFDRAEAERFAAAYRPDGDWATLPELARAMRVARKSAWRWIQAGKVPGAVRDGAGQWLIPRATFNAMTGRDAT